MIAFLDIETGGFNKEKHALCEIGIVIVDDELNIVYEHSSLVLPYKTESGNMVEYDPKSMEVHGITMTEIIETGKIIFKVIDYIDDLFYHYDIDTIAGHNINRFDLPWMNYLKYRFTAYDYDVDYIIDTLEISKQKLKGSHKLEDLCDRFAIQKGNHRALSDAKASLELYKHLIKM